MHRTACFSLFGLALAACGAPEASSPALANEAEAPEPAETVSSTPSTWSVVGDESRVSFLSIKAGEIAEAHHFTEVFGSVEADGAVEIDIPLDTVETAVDIRNERMRELFFETASFPTASVTTQLDLAQFDDLEVGEQMRTPLTATLHLHGVDAAIEPEVFVTRIAENRVTVQSIDPVLVQVSDFGLAAGLAQLQELANLPSITPVAPVSFTLMFEG